MLKRFAGAAIVLISVWSIATMVSAQPNQAISMAVGKPGSESFIFGTELWALGQIALKPKFGIELSSVEIAEESERLASLGAADVQIALVDGTSAATPSSEQMRTVLALRVEEGAPVKGRPAQILAHKDVDPEVIYRLTRAIFENTHLFYGTKERLGNTALDLSAANGDVPLHPGAARYFEEVGMMPEPPLAQMAAAVSTATYRDFDDKALSEEERAQIAAACRQALDLGALSAVLGDLSSSGCEAYQTYLEEQAAARPDLSQSSTGQGGPAIALDSIPARETPRAGRDAMPSKDLHHLPNKNPRQPTM